MTSLTKKDVNDVVKGNNKYLENLMGDMANTILNGVQSMFDERDIVLKDHTNKLDKLSNDITDVKQDIKFLHQDVKDIVTDMSDKPSRAQFETFKSKFDNYPTV